MSSGEIVAIKIKTYLKDYFTHKFGEEPIKATNDNKLFPFLLRYLKPKPKKWKPPVSSSDILLLELPFNRSVNIRHCNYIHSKDFSSISSFFYGIFWSNFIEYMNKKVIDERWQIKYSIIHFMDTNNIQFDKVNYDSLKRIYYRYRFPDGKENIIKIDPEIIFNNQSEKLRKQFKKADEI